MFVYVCVYKPVDELPSNGAFEEARAAVAGQDTVVFPGTGVTADDADQSQILTLGAWHRKASGALLVLCRRRVQTRSIS